jgi:hypothetical protein
MSLGAGLGKVAGRVFRIGHLGDFNDLMLAGTLCGVEMGLRVAGVSVGAGVEAALERALAAAGYEHYETSAYARPGRRARHNLNYWTFGDYLGIGAGAHGKLSFPDRIVRQARYRQPQEYMTRAIGGNAVQTEHAVAVEDIPFEFMMNALRLTEGFPLALFEERSGVPLVAALKGLDQAERRGLIERDHERVVPTALGRRFLNDLLQIFLPAAAIRQPPQPVNDSEENQGFPPKPPFLDGFPP